MNLQMKREPLQKQNQTANESAGVLGAILGQFWHNFRRKSETNITVKCENAIESKRISESGRSAAW